MNRLFRFGLVVGLLGLVAVVGAQVIRDVDPGQEALVNFTPTQPAVAYQFELAAGDALQLGVTYLGASFPMTVEAYRADGTAALTQPINAAGDYPLSLAAGTYRLLFVVQEGTTGRAAVQFQTSEAGTTVAQNPTPSNAQPSSNNAQPSSNNAQPGSNNAQPGNNNDQPDSNNAQPDSNNDQPESDQDGDGVPDSQDVCVATPGSPDNAGCPAAGTTANNNPGPETDSEPAANTGQSNTPLEATPAPTSQSGSISGSTSDVNSDGFLPEPGEYTFTAVREGCYTGAMNDIPPDQAYESFMFITHGADGNSIIVSFEGKDENIFVRGDNSPQFFSLTTPLASVENGRRTEAIVFDSDPIEYYDLTLDPRDTSCYAIQWYELNRVSDATTREERAANTQTGGGASSGGPLPSGSYQADLSQSGRGCENSEVVFPDSGPGFQFTVEAAPNGTDLIVTSANGQSVTFLPDGPNTYAADDGSLRLVITVENGEITRYAEYVLSGGSCETTRIYEVQQTGQPEQPGGDPEPGPDGGTGPTYEINGQPIQEGEWQGPMSLLGVGCPGAEVWDATSANSRGEFITATLTFTPQGIEYREPAFSSFLLLEPTGVDNQFRAEVTGFTYQIDFDTINSGTLSRYAFMGGTCSSGEAAQFALTHVGN